MGTKAQTSVDSGCSLAEVEKVDPIVTLNKITLEIAKIISFSFATICCVSQFQHLWITSIENLSSVIFPIPRAFLKANSALLRRWRYAYVLGNRHSLSKYSYIKRRWGKTLLITHISSMNSHDHSLSRYPFCKFLLPLLINCVCLYCSMEHVPSLFLPTPNEEKENRIGIVKNEIV